MKSGILTEPELVGREKELIELEQLLASAFRGTGKTVFVSGEAGTGKTRLVNEFLKTAQERGATILKGWCLSNAPVPYLPFIKAFNSLLSSDIEEEQIFQPGNQANFTHEQLAEIHSAEISGFLTGSQLTQKPGQIGTLGPQTWKDRAFLAVSNTLQSMTAQNPVVLFIDDLQWADSASLALIHYISRFVSSERIFLLATFREGALVSDAEGRPLPLAETLRNMRREDLFSEIKLLNLNQENILKIAENLVGGRVQAGFAEKLTMESQGNALFVVESLRMLSERGGLIQRNSIWQLAVDKLEIPSKMRDIILQRLALLKHNQRRVLDAACVIGERFDAELLSSVLGQDCLEVLETLNMIAQSTSLIRVEEGSYRFNHAKYRETMYDELPTPLRKGYHARIAEKLENVEKNANLLLGDIAFHYAQAGNNEKALNYAFAAGKDALERYSNKEAIEHFTNVLQTIEDTSERFEEKSIALEGLGDAYYANSNFSQAVNTFEQLAGFQKDVVKLRALRKAMYAAYYQGDIPKLKDLTQKAEDNATSDRLEAARVLHQKARVIGIQGQTAASLAANEQALRVFEEEYSVPDAAWSLFVVGQLATTLGEAEKGIAASLRSISLYDELGDFRSQLEAYLNAGFSFQNCMLPQEARSMYSKVVETNERLKMGDYIELIPAYAFWGSTLHSTDPASAISMILKALMLSEKTDSYLYLGFILESLVLQYTIAGDMINAGKYFEKLMMLPREVFTNGYTQFQLNLMNAVYSAGKGQFEESNRYFENYFDYVKVRYQTHTMQTVNRRYYAWVLSKQGRVEEAKTQIELTRKLRETAIKKFRHVNIQSSLVTFTHPEIYQTFEIHFDLVNVSRIHASISRIENLLIPGFKIVDYSSDCVLKDGVIEFRSKEIKPFEVKTVKLTMQAIKTGIFPLTPSVFYVDESGETKTCNSHTVTIDVQPVAEKLHAANEITSGSAGIDSLLLGGIPKGYAIALVSPPFEERRHLVEKFLEAGPKNGQTTFDVTSETPKAEILAEEFPTDLYVFICNPRANSIAKRLPNIIKLNGVDNLTDLDIALTKTERTIEPQKTGPRRACIEIISDVLLQHHAVTTRKWISALLSDLKSKGFTTLAIIDPNMHPPEELQAVLGLFDGEIRITENESTNGPEKTLKIRRMYNHKYKEEELILTK